MNKYLLLIITIVIGLSSTSCRSKKNPDGSAAVKSKSAKFLVKKIEQDKIDVKWLDAKAKIDFKTDDIAQSATLYIRMCKDSAIWMVGKKFGFEGVRALVTPDSVFMLDRLQNQYRVSDMSLIQNQFSLPLSFYDLQDIILGNLILVPDTKSLSTAIDQKQYHLSEKEAGEMTKDYWLNGYSYSPERMRFTMPAQNRAALIENGDHRKIDGAGLFSHDRYLNFRSPETGEVILDMEFTKVAVNEPVSLKFEVPSHYERVD